MLPIIFIADVHLTTKRPRYRTDNYVETSLRKLKFILDQAEKHNAIIVCGGDLLDKPSVKPELLNRVIKLIGDSGIDFNSVAGQHDQSFHNPDLMKSNYGSLIEAGVLDHLTHAEFSESMCLYGRSWGETYQEADWSRGCIHILVAHETVTKGDPPPWLSAKSAEQMIEEHPGFDYILTGDFHEKFVVTHKGCTLVNSGPMLRSSIDKRDFKPACWLINDDGVTEIPIPIEKDVFDVREDDLPAESNNAELEARIDEFLTSLGFSSDRPSFPQIVNKGLESIGDSRADLKSEIMEIMDYVRQD